MVKDPGIKNLAIKSLFLFLPIAHFKTDCSLQKNLTSQLVTGILHRRENSCFYKDERVSKLKQSLIHFNLILNFLDDLLHTKSMLF